MENIKTKLPQVACSGYENEIRIIGSVPCAPCERPICKKSEHLCMQSITVEKVRDAAKKLLENKHTRTRQICESKNS